MDHNASHNKKHPSAISYPDCDHKADQGKTLLDTPEALYDKVFGSGDDTVGEGENLDNGQDEGEDVEGNDSPAPSDQILGPSVVAIVAVAVPDAMHDQSDDQLEQTGAGRGGLLQFHSPATLAFSKRLNIME